MNKRKKKEKQINESYAITLSNWDLNYGVGFSKPVQELGLSPETYDLTCHGKLIYPQKVAGRDIQVNLVPNRQLTKILNDKSYENNEGVGTLQVWGNEKNRCIIFLPHDVMPSIMTAIAAKKWLYITMDGNVLNHGHAQYMGLVLNRAWKNTLRNNFRRVVREILGRYSRCPM